MTQNNQFFMPEGYQSDHFLGFFHTARERQYVVPATVLSIAYPDGVPTWVIGFRDYPDFKGFVPAEETGVDEILIPRFMGQGINVHILGIDKENNYLACSRKSVIDVLEPKVKESLVKDSIITATVKTILPKTTKHSLAQLVVDIGGGVLSYIPSTRAKIKLSQRLEEQFMAGQNVKVKVLNTDPIEVSIKDARPNPWETIIFNRGQFISGNIINIANNLVFIEPDLAPGIVGIAPMPFLGDLARKDKVNCFVVSCDNENKRLMMNIKSRII